MSNNSDKHIKHGHFCNGKQTRLYAIWAGMKRRCLNANVKIFKNYGGRGIEVCDEWMEFIPFKDWALTNGYRDDLTIDRKDNDGNYEPSNCRWVTHKENCNNTRMSRLITYQGKTLNLKQWSEIIGIGESTIRRRIDRSKWPIEKALTTPVLGLR